MSDTAEKNGIISEELILPAYGNSEDIVRKMAEDPAIQEQDPEVVASAIKNREIRRKAMGILQNADDEGRSFLTRYAQETWGQPWVERSAWIASNVATAGAYIGAIATGSLPLLTATCALATLGGLTHDASKRYKDLRRMESKRIRGTKSPKYDAYIRDIIKDAEKKNRLRTPESMYWFIAPTRTLDNDGAAEGAGDTKPRTLTEAEKDELEKRAFYSPEKAEEKLRALQEIEKNRTDTGWIPGFGKGLGSSLITEYMPLTDGGDGKPDGSTPLFTLPCEVRDGVEVGVMMPASGKPILYATAVNGQFATEEAARIREKEMMSSFRADSDSVGQAKIRAEKLRSSLYNTMIGRTPMSRGYEAYALKKPPKDKLTDGDKKSQVKNISTKDMELAIQEKGLKYVREFCKDQWIRAGGPERRMEGTNIFITPPGYTRYKPWGIGSALEMGSLNMALNDSLKARPGKDGKMKQDKSRPAPGRNPYKIHYAIDYPKADGTRGSYEALTLLASDSPKETFFEAERRSILEMVGEPERSRLMAAFGIDMEITPKEPLKDEDGRTIADGASPSQDSREQNAGDDIQRTDENSIGSEGLGESAGYMDRVLDGDASEGKTKPEDATSREIVGADDFIRRPDVELMEAKRLPYDVSVHMPKPGQPEIVHDDETGISTKADGDGSAVIVRDNDTDTERVMPATAAEREFGIRHEELLGGEEIGRRNTAPKTAYATVRIPSGVDIVEVMDDDSIRHGTEGGYVVAELGDDGNVKEGTARILDESSYRALYSEGKAIERSIEKTPEDEAVKTEDIKTEERAAEDDIRESGAIPEEKIKQEEEEKTAENAGENRSLDEDHADDGLSIDTSDTEPDDKEKESIDSPELPSEPADSHSTEEETGRDDNGGVMHERPEDERAREEEAPKVQEEAPEAIRESVSERADAEAEDTKDNDLSDGSYQAPDGDVSPIVSDAGTPDGSSAPMEEKDMDKRGDNPEEMAEIGREAPEKPLSEKSASEKAAAENSVSGNEQDKGTPDSVREQGSDSMEADEHTPEEPQIARCWKSADGDGILRMTPEYRNGAATGALIAGYYGLTENGEVGQLKGETRFEEYSDGIPDTFTIRTSDGPKNVDLSCGWYRVEFDSAFRSSYNREGVMETLRSEDGNTVLGLRHADDTPSWEADLYKRGENGRFAMEERLSGTGLEGDKPEDRIKDLADFRQGDRSLLEEAVNDAAVHDENELRRNFMIHEVRENESIEERTKGYTLDKESGAIVLTGVVTRDKVEAAIKEAAALGEDAHFDKFVLKDTTLMTVDAFATADSLAAKNGMSFTGLADLNRSSYGLIGTEFAMVSPFAMLKDLHYAHFDYKIPDFGGKDSGIPALPLFKGRENMVISASSVDTVPEKAFSECTVMAFIDNSMTEGHTIDFRSEAFSLDDPDKVNNASRKKNKDNVSTATWKDYQSELSQNGLKGTFTDADRSAVESLFSAARSASVADAVNLRDNAELLAKRYATFVLTGMIEDYRKSDGFMAKAMEAVPGLKDLSAKLGEAADDAEKALIQKDIDNLLYSSPETSRLLSEWSVSEETTKNLMERLSADEGYQKLLTEVGKADERIRSQEIFKEHLSQILDDPLLRSAVSEGRMYMHVENLAMSDIGDAAFRGRQVAFGMDGTLRKEAERTAADRNAVLDDIRETAGDEGWKKITDAITELRYIQEDRGGEFTKGDIAAISNLRIRQAVSKAGFEGEAKDALIEKFDTLKAIDGMLVRFGNGEMLVRALGSRTGTMGVQNAGIAGVIQTDVIKRRTKEIRAVESEIRKLEKEKTDAEKKKNWDKVQETKDRIKEAYERKAVLTQTPVSAEYGKWAFAGNEGLRYTNIIDNGLNLYSGCANVLDFYNREDKRVSKRDNRYIKNVDLGKIATNAALTAYLGIKGAKAFTFTSSMLYLTGAAALGVLFAVLKIASAIRGHYMNQNMELSLRAKADAIMETGRNVRVRFDGSAIDIIPVGKTTRSDEKELEARYQDALALYKDSPELAALALHQNTQAVNAMLRKFEEEGIRFTKEEMEKFQEDSAKGDQERNDFAAENGINGEISHTSIPEGLEGDGKEKTIDNGNNRDDESGTGRKNPENEIRKKDEGGRDDR